MIKYKALVICLFLIPFLCYGNTVKSTSISKKSENVIRVFSEIIQEWSKDKNNSDYGEELLKCFSKDTRVATEFMNRLAKAYKVVSKKMYDNTTYVNNIEKWFDDNKTNHIQITNIKERLYDELYIEKGSDALKKDYRFYSGKFQVLTGNGRIVEEYMELYYVRIKDSKIHKIETYTEVIKDGKRKISIDFSDLEEEETIGFNFNYSKNWPISASVSYSNVFFMIALDLGFNLDDNCIVQHKLTMEDILNYEKERRSYDPRWYITLTPSCYLKYVSIGCGIGLMFYQKTIDEKFSSKYDSIKNSFSSGGYQSKTRCSLMYRPNIKGFIPLNDEWFLTLNASYELIPRIRNKNGFSFGVGMQYRFN